MSKLSVRTLLVVSALAWSPVVSVANADSFVLAEATLDWTRFSFRVSDGLTINSVVYGYLGSTAVAETRHGGLETVAGTRNSAANSHYSNALGEATSQSRVVDGALTSRSEAASFGEPTLDFAATGAFASRAFWLYGSGVGVLTVEVPYELRLKATADPGATVGAMASVSLELGPGAGWYTSDSLMWDSSSPSMTRTGTLVLSREFFEPTWGPLVSIGAGASSEAVTAVPEPSTMALLALGGLSTVCLRRKTTNRVG